MMTIFDYIYEFCFKLVKIENASWRWPINKLKGQQTGKMAISQFRAGYESTYTLKFCFVYRKTSLFTPWRK
jgi:hypothetical protein